MHGGFECNCEASDNLPAVKGQRLSVHFSSATHHWLTPQALYEALDGEFRFNLDPCPPDFATDGLLLDWTGRRVFCNPPYGPSIPRWISKGPSAQLAVFLLPARTDTRWFHELCLPHAQEIRFLKGRLRFSEGAGSAPFPSMLAIFEQRAPLILKFH